MSLLYAIFEWHAVTYAIPFIGIVLCFFLLLNNKICTKRKAVSTAISLFLMMWLLLTWADWGSNNSPSYQILWVRLIMLVIAVLVVFELKQLRLKLLRLSSTNRRLKKQNIALIKSFAALKSCAPKHFLDNKDQDHVSQNDDYTA